MERFEVIFFVMMLTGANLAQPPKELEVIRGGPGSARKVTQTLLIDNAYPDNYGTWGPIELCPKGMFASSVEVKYEARGHTDETAINGVKLYCTTENSTQMTYVSSSTGRNGEWYNMHTCKEGLITGFRAKILEYQGVFKDDVAIEDVQVECEKGKEIIDTLPKDETVKHLGEWSSFAQCHRDSVVCGIQTRLECASLGDEVAIADFAFFCCNLFETNSKYEEENNGQ